MGNYESKIRWESFDGRVSTHWKETTDSYGTVCALWDLLISQVLQNSNPTNGGVRLYFDHASKRQLNKICDFVSQQVNARGWGIFPPTKSAFEETMGPPLKKFLHKNQRNYGAASFSLGVTASAIGFTTGGTFAAAGAVGAIAAVTGASMGAGLVLGAVAAGVVYITVQHYGARGEVMLEIEFRNNDNNNNESTSSSTNSNGDEKDSDEKQSLLRSETSTSEIEMKETNISSSAAILLDGQLTKNSRDDRICTICYNEWSASCIPMMLPCHHVFCDRCIPKLTEYWGQKGRQKSCPMCRQFFADGEVKKSNRHHY